MEKITDDIVNHANEEIVSEEPNGQNGDLNGLIDGIYYENGKPVHKGVFMIGDDIYYAGKGGRIAVNERHTIHSSMSNGILKRGTYVFDTEGKLIPGSFIKLQKRKKKLFKTSYWKKDFVWVLAASGLLLCTLAIISLLNNRNANNTADGDTLPYDFARIDSDGIILPVFNEPVYLCKDPVADYYKGTLTLDEACRRNNEAGPYKGLDFKYDLRKGGVSSSDGSGPEAVLEISETKDFDSFDQFSLDPSKTSITIDNLFPNRTYYYRVIVEESYSNNTSSETTFNGQFTTAATDRFIYIPELKNTRDIGGYKTVDGKTTKYGMLIRGSELDGLVVSDYFLTDREAAASFGFACDLDLRDGSIFYGNYKSMLGDNVSHKFYESPMYGTIFSEDYKESLQKIFHDLADPANYPMYLHCTYGADRTGTIIFLIQGVLGVNKDDMERQYALTGFCINSATARNLNPIYGGLEGTAGDTINEKIVNYLVEEVGVPMSEIESIRLILLED